MSETINMFNDSMNILHTFYFNLIMAYVCFYNLVYNIRICKLYWNTVTNTYSTQVLDEISYFYRDSKDTIIT